MTLVQLTDSLAVNPASVASIQVIRDSEYVTVRMVDGQEHKLSRDYGKGVFQTYERIVALVNEARTA